MKNRRNLEEQGKIGPLRRQLEADAALRQTVSEKTNLPQSAAAQVV
jgi:hypothetical protein